VRNDQYEIPSDHHVWADRLRSGQARIHQAIRAVGRIELRGHPSYPWVGTAWLIAPDIIVTNRHVAEEFATSNGRGFVFRPGLNGEAISGSIDYMEEYGSGGDRSVAFDQVLFIARRAADQPDLAVIRLRRDVDTSPIPLAATSRPRGQYIAVIGYPARDDRRNDPQAARDIFGDIYEKKRLAPGEIQGNDHPVYFEHNCTTLGGNSGSVVLDAESGEAIGLHFAGRFERANYAVRSDVLRRYLDSLGRSREYGLIDEAPRNASDYLDRAGYQGDFLGNTDAEFVALPQVTGSRSRDVQRQTSGSRRGDSELKYTHFSIVMSKSRKLPFFTAVNIDGSSLSRPRRGRDVWRFDPRIAESAQLGNSLYAGNNLDRGHLVRRLDPVWGSSAEAKLAEEDTFHYTNAAPQHARLNQGSALWAGLEDYILNNADTRDLKVSAFTGPVFGDHDIVYRQARIPVEFWKVVVNVRADGRLSATAYLLSQGQFLDDIEFAFGPFRTFQVPIRRVETLTGLSFGALRDVDPLEVTEGVGGYVALESLSQILL
jgi:endonuclease G